MDKLWMMIGAWTVVSAVFADGAWREGEPTEAEIKADVSDRMLVERGVYEAGGRRFEPVNIYSFDPFRNTYRIASLDDTVGLMDIYEGELVDGCLHYTNERSATWYRRPDGTEFKFRLTHCIEADRMSVLIEQAPAASQDWEPFMRMTYRRRLDPTLDADSAPPPTNRVADAWFVVPSG